MVPGMSLPEATQDALIALYRGGELAAPFP